MTDTKQAHLQLNGQQLELPIYEPTLGHSVIDVGQLGKQGAFTFDPGFVSTASCKSDITFINGEEGELLYRGYPITELAEKADYLEVCYLLINGQLPNKQQKQTFDQTILDAMHVDDQVIQTLQGFAQDAHPMSMMMGLMAAIAGQNHEQYDIHNSHDRLSIATELIAKVPTLSALCYRHSQGLPYLQPKKGLGYAENFLYMMFGDESPDPVFSNAIDAIFTLHADHEQNASTSTVRMAGSTGTDAFAAITAGIGALWGPAHGGANEAALRMLEEIGHIDNIEHYLDRAKDKSDSFRLMGFGHRVYKNYDPRAKAMKKACHEVLEKAGKGDEEVFKVAKELERLALEDHYFIDRKLFPNVDFYSGITQNALGIPHNMFTVMFTLGRCSGWIAHWHEMFSNPLRISRPRQLYTGHDQRPFVNIENRS